MSKAQAAARFMTEVAPPQVVSIMRRRKVPRSLETIAEDDREQLAYGPDHGYHHHHQAAAGGATASSSGFAAARVRRAAPAPAQARARTGGFMRELSKYFSHAHGHAGSWESSHKGHARTGGFMRELSKYFYDAHGHAGSWESSHKGHRRAVFGQQWRKNGA